jgi:hypothetical protein
MMPAFEPLLLGVGLAHGLVGVICVGLLLVDATPILGVHPAWKPLKFAMSIAAFLVTVAALMPSLSVGEGVRWLLAGALSLSLTVEMTAIGTQALRGRRSHFNVNVQGPLDALMTRAMLLGIVVVQLTMAAVTLIATALPVAQPALLTAAFRAALWIFQFAAVSGIGMGNRGRHTIGGDDGGPGMAVTNWSATHGDLRVSHFFSLHALQVIPLFAIILHRLPLGANAQWTLLVLGIGANAFLAGWTWTQALASRPLLRLTRRPSSRQPVAPLCGRSVDTTQLHRLAERDTGAVARATSTPNTWP